MNVGEVVKARRNGGGWYTGGWKAEERRRAGERSFRVRGRGGREGGRAKGMSNEGNAREKENNRLACMGVVARGREVLSRSAGPP